MQNVILLYLASFLGISGVANTEFSTYIPMCLKIENVNVINGEKRVFLSKTSMTSLAF